MKPERLHRIQKIYSDAEALLPEERQDFLDKACSGDLDLRSEVESLLAMDESTWFDRSAIEFAAESLAKEGAGLLVGRTLGRYQLLALAGRGGMGDVYCGVDLRLNRLVAVKILPPYLASDPLRFKRFEQEARNIAAMSHPHICVLYDAGRDAGTQYLVFEYLAGELLSDRLQNEALPLPEALQYLTQIAEALEHAHQQGIVHHDLKPQNIMLTRRGVKLLDFGIAELQAEGGPRSQTASGTPAYMAPEQAAGRATDARTDIFAFGLIAKEMISIRAAPEILESVITTCLAHRPDQRWQSISEVLALLRTI